MMYHFSQFATAIRGEQWFDAVELNIILQYIKVTFRTKYEVGIRVRKPNNKERENEIKQ